VNCEEHECVKGEHHKEDNLRRSRAETGQALARARAALSDEEYGADRWVQHHLKNLTRIDELLAVYEDPSVPVGARVRLARGAEPQLLDRDGWHPIKLIRS
jgi:hypothetical protein